MEAEVIGAYITAVGGLVVAVFSFVTSRSVAKLAESAKRSEQIRLHATEMGENLLSLFADLIVRSEGLEFLLSRRTEKILSKKEVKKYFIPMGKILREIRKGLYSSAIYVDQSIRDRFSSISDKFTTQKSFEKWGELVNELREQHQEIAKQFRETYLGHTLGME